MAAGALVVVLGAATLILLAQRADPPDENVGALGNARQSSPEEVRAYLNDMFDRLDRDGSGAVERAEAPQRQVISATARDGTIRQLPLTQAEWFAKGDGDGDGRVTRTEFLGRLVPPVQGILGVPADWRPRPRA